MGRNVSPDQVAEHSKSALVSFEMVMKTLIESNEISKVDKLSYWLEDWATYLSFESQFTPTSLRRYKRGEIVKVHLGFNIGSEEGGLHYGVVLNKNDSIKSPTLTIVPLTSVKPHTDINRLRPGNVYLGDELYSSMNLKITTMKRSILDELSSIQYAVHNSDLNETDIDRMKKA